MRRNIPVLSGRWIYSTYYKQKFNEKRYSHKKRHLYWQILSIGKVTTIFGGSQTDDSVTTDDKLTHLWHKVKYSKYAFAWLSRLNLPKQGLNRSLLNTHQLPTTLVFQIYNLISAAHMSLLHIFEKQMDKITIMVESATDNSEEDVLCNRGKNALTPRNSHLKDWKK